MKSATPKDVLFCSYLCHVLLDQSKLFSLSNANTNNMMSTSTKQKEAMEFDELANIYAATAIMRERFFSKAQHLGWNVSEHNLTIAGQFHFELISDDQKKFK